MKECYAVIEKAVEACAAKCGGAPLRHFTPKMIKELANIEKDINEAALAGDLKTTKAHMARWLAAHKWAMEREGKRL